MTDDERYEAEYKLFVKEAGFNEKADIIRSHPSRAAVFPHYLIARNKFRERLAELEQIPHESSQYKIAFEQFQKSKTSLEMAERKLFGSTNMAEQIYEQSKGRITDNPLEKATQWGVDVIQNRQRAREVSPSAVGAEERSDINWPGDRPGADGGEVLVQAYDRSTGHVNSYYRSRPA